MEKEETQNFEETDQENNKESNEGILNSEKVDDDQNEEKVQTAEEEITGLKDKLTRAFAEMENQRRRFEKEKEEVFDYGGFSFAKETLNLLDNLERSKSILENDETLKGTSALNKLIEHINIINKDMLSIFKKNNIEPIKCLNEKLDPNLHQAMMEIEDDKKQTGTVVQEIQKGFKMKDRLLRPSLVAVSKKKENKDALKTEKNEENQEKREEN